MKKGPWFLCVLALTSTIGCVWEEGTGENVDINVASYADFNAGGEWVFEDHSGDNSTTATYGGLQDVPGYADPVHVLQFDHGDTLYFREDLSEKLYLAGTQSDGVYSEALPLLRESFEAGREYGPYETDDSDCGVFVVFERDNVSVPYDDFERAVHAEVTTLCLGHLPKVRDYWFGKHVGLIKWVDDDGDTWYLHERN